MLKNIFLLVATLLSTIVFAQVKMSNGLTHPQASDITQRSGCPALLHYTVMRLQDNMPQDLCQYAGKVVLVVNTASFCGLTKQYRGLEALYRKYGSQGFVVLGFPSNDFGNQEPGSSKAIVEFCYNTYGVKFPMFAKSSVAGEKANPFYLALARAGGSVPKWNFHKYLISRNGNLIASYSSDTAPESPLLVKDIESALKLGTAENPPIDPNSEDELVVDDIEKAVGM